MHLPYGAPSPSPHSIVSASSWGTVHTPITGPKFTNGVNAVLTGACGSIDLTMFSLLPENKRAEPAFSSQDRNRIVLYGGPGNWYQPVQTGNVLTVQDILTGVFSLYCQKLEEADRSIMPQAALDDVLFYARARNASDPRSPSYCVRLDTLQNRARFNGIQWSQIRQSWEILMK